MSRCEYHPWTMTFSNNLPTTTDGPEIHIVSEMRNTYIDKQTLFTPHISFLKHL